MKHLLNALVVSMITVLSFGCACAIDLQNQSEVIKSKLKIGKYIGVGGDTSTIKINSIQPERNQPHKHVIVTIGDSEYFPDNIAYPATYYRAFYEGNAKLQEKVGYSVTRGSHVGKERLVVVKDYIFLLHDWKNKDHYSVSRVLELGDGKPNTGISIGSFLGAMATVAIGGTVGEDLSKLKNTVLQPYLDQATSEQKRYYTSWIKNPENARTKQYLDDLYTAMTQAMRNYNKKIYNSPAYQRMLAHHRWAEKHINIEVFNNTDHTVWLGNKTRTDGSGIPSGGSVKKNCTNDLYVHYSAESTSGTKYYNASSGCGGTARIRQ